MPFNSLQFDNKPAVSLTGLWVWLNSQMNPGRMAVTEFSGDEGYPLLQPSPDFSSTQRRQPPFPQMCHCYSRSPFQTGTLDCTGFVVNLFPSHETMSTHSWRGCVGRWGATQAHSICNMDQLWASRRFVCVNFTYFSMVIVWNCWNIKGYITVLLVLLGMKAV